MSHFPLLSIIIANYNNDKYLFDCLDSVLVQTFNNYEIIVSDDGSTDQSQMIIHEYEGKYSGVIKGIINTTNRGVAINRHEAILQATGEYITTLDSDDYYFHSRKLENEMELIKYHKDQYQKDIIAFSNTILVSEDKHMIRGEGNPGNIKNGMIFNDIITRGCMIPRDFIMLKSAYFQAGGYDFSISTHEDWDLKIRLSLKFDFYYTGDYGTGYRLHDQGLSSRSFKMMKKNMWKVFNKNIKFGEPHKQKELRAKFELYILRFDQLCINELKRHFLENCTKMKTSQRYLLFIKDVFKNFGLNGFWIIVKMINKSIFKTNARTL